MPSPSIRVLIDSSQFPANVSAQLLECLRSRRVDARFLYEGRGQVERWLALHEAFSPARTDPDCRAIYDTAYTAASCALKGPAVHLFGISCGGAHKEMGLLEVLNEAGRKTAFSPVDVSLPMVLTASAEASNRIAAEQCRPCLLDLQRAEDARARIEELRFPACDLLFTFFGTIHNFEPDEIMPKLGALLESSELLLLSANLAPAENYDESLRAILPGYDNELAREWLISFLRHLGAETDGKVHFALEPNAGDETLKRICAYYTFRDACRLTVSGGAIDFKRGESIRLFFSYRYTAPLLRKCLSRHGLAVLQEWLAESGQEGVFLVRRAQS